VYQLLMEKCDL